jgi:hypothetical protein
MTPMQKAERDMPSPPRRFPAPWSVGPSRIYGQFMIVIFRVPPPSEGTVNVSSLRWHVGDGGGEGGATTLATGGG